MTGTATFQNTGNTTWNFQAGGGYSLQMTNGFWGSVSISSSAMTVPPGQSVSFTINARAPRTNGQTVAFAVQLRHNGSGFGAMASHNVLLGSGAMNAQIVSGPTFNPWTINPSWPFSVTILIKNTGTAPWWNSNVDSISPFRFADQGSNPTVFGSAYTEIVSGGNTQGYVDPGETISLNFVLAAPSTTGNTPFTWRMRQDGGQAFGDTTSSAVTVTAIDPNLALMTQISPLFGSGVSQAFQLKFSGGQSAPYAMLWQVARDYNAVPMCQIGWSSDHLLKIRTWDGVNDPVWVDQGYLGENRTIQTPPCSVDLGLSSDAITGNNVTLNVKMNFTNVLTGINKVSGVVFSPTGSTGYWIYKGDWTVPVPRQVGVSVAPVSVSVNSGTTQQFSATVTGTSNTSVTWSATAGSISQVGVYTAPTVTSATTATVRATSVTDATKFAQAVVSIPAPSGGVAVTMTPTTASINSGGPQQFSATVTGTSNAGVTWSATAGSISQAGFYTAPTVTAATTATVRATSVADASKFVEGIVSIAAPSGAVSIVISPTNALINSGATQQFTATITGTSNTAVSWSANAGGVSSNGLYTAQTVSAVSTATVRATSVADATKFADATVTISPVSDAALASWAVNPGSALLVAARVQGTATLVNNGGTTWNLQAGGGYGLQMTGGWSSVTITTSSTSVAPGQAATFLITARAPRVAQTVAFAVQMQRNGVGFGALLSQSVQISAGTLNAQLISLTLPGSVDTGAPVNVSVILKNSGTQPWWNVGVDSATPFRFANQGSNPTLFGPAYIDIGSGSNTTGYVDPGETITLNYVLSAPSTPGATPFVWRMKQEGGGAFGDTTSASLTINAGMPYVGEVSPLNGTGVVQQFQIKFGGGQASVDALLFQVSGGYNAPPMCQFAWTPDHRILMRTWDGVNEPVWGDYGYLGEYRTIQTPFCYVDLSQSTDTIVGNNVTLNIRLGFSNLLNGLNRVGGYVFSSNGTSTGQWVFKGDWTVPSGQVSVAISPTAVTLVPGTNQQFNATVTGSTNTSLLWSTMNGGISQSGLYTAPGIPYGTIFYDGVKASAVVDGTKFAEASVTIVPFANAVSIGSTTPMYLSGRMAQFTIPISGGTSPVNEVRFYANSTFANPGGCLVVVSPQSGAVSLTTTPAGGTYYLGTLGTNAIIQNQYCSLNLANSSAINSLSGSQNTSVVRLDLSFTPWTNYLGYINIYGKASSTADSMPDFQYLGWWFLN